ncbi:MAG: radical SAM protein [Desulfurococcales archaeon]|nr:radical SAM protein [Desulfurococcales archaeon]
MEYKQQENIYYARSNEAFRIKQKTLVGGVHTYGYVPIRVPSKWVKGNGSCIVALFYKTGENIVCPHFWELKAWTGCPFNCSYCYLQGTFRGAERKTPRMKNEKLITRYLEEFLRWADSNGLITLLNTGEVADSLGVPAYVEKFLEIALPILRKHPRHKVLFLTKGGTHHVKVLEEIPGDMRDRFIVSFSISPHVVVERFEKGTASSSDRIEAARIAQEMGFEVRIRIDPMIPVEGWILYYSELVRELLDKVKPSRITLGTLRALRKTIIYARDRSWAKYVPEPSPWGKRVERQLRIRMYELVIEVLREYGFKGSIALCKETPNVWNTLHSKGLIENPGTPGIWENVMCNCKL